MLILKNGQQVAVIPYVACQQCPACKSGRTNCCEKNFSHWRASGWRF
ncbi:alcohol dehydrogenase catalytic domain-containing protein [Escherichia coli]|nr:alcohol dehydrogenase catalytic domain-containing protein [Escherichia coli]